MKVGQITSVSFFENEKFAIGKILKGGMGIVYQLLPIRTGSPTIALKTLQEVMKEKDFERECESWLSVTQHKNVAHAFAFGKWEGLPSILIEWYPKSMADLNSNELNEYQLENLFMGIVSALDFAYEKVKMVHQDIKPANVLIDKEGNPKLSDFGLARCGTSLIFDKSIQYGNTSSTSFGKVGGTPFFMAPELFTGDKPSIKTDIFSLGVTFYTFLTNEHPFVDPSTNTLTLPKLRIEPLNRILEKRGKGFNGIKELIIKCLSADPRGRPNNYKEIETPGKIAKNGKDSKTETLSRIQSMVSKAMLYREQKNFEPATVLLLEGLKEFPEEPFILNSLGILKITQGQREAGIEIFVKAFKILEAKNGKYDKYFYPDPAINLAGQLLAKNQFNEAQKVLKTTWGWSINAAPVVKEKIPVWSSQRLFCEFGRMFLYDGDYETTTKYLSEALATKGKDNQSLYCLLEASWITNKINIHADFILRSRNGFNPEDVLGLLCGCLAAQFTNSQLKRKFYDSISTTAHEKIRTAEDLAVLERGSLLNPKSLETQKFVIISFDEFLTGGKNIGHIRQIHQPRLA